MLSPRSAQAVVEGVKDFLSVSRRREYKNLKVPSAVVTTRALRIRGLLRLHDYADYADYAKWHDEGPSGQPSIETRLVHELKEILSYSAVSMNIPKCEGAMQKLRAFWEP